MSSTEKPKSEISFSKRKKKKDLVFRQPDQETGVKAQINLLQTMA